ncbi:MAG: CBS domain-containing protein [Saprospiraceae bacterium]|nr:CBS domain-containing protein [Saprospiraceae bacterium]
MNVKVSDIMIQNVVTSVKHKSVGHIRQIMNDQGIHSLPIVSPNNEVEGIVTSQDFLEDHSQETPVSQIMTKSVYTVPLYSDVYIAARIMRNHHIHHLVVTDDKKVVGVLSSFDLLSLVEDHRFVMKNPPTPAKKKSGRV